MARWLAVCAVLAVFAGCQRAEDQRPQPGPGTGAETPAEGTGGGPPPEFTEPPGKMGENAAPETRDPQYATPPAAAETDCQLRKATGGMPPDEAQAYVEEVTAEMIESGRTLSEILAERGFEC